MNKKYFIIIGIIIVLAVLSVVVFKYNIGPKLITTTTPANIVLSNMRLNASCYKIGDQVTLTITAKNTGGTYGSKTVTISGDWNAYQTVSLAAGASKDIVFTTTASANGNWTVNCGSMSATIKVATSCACNNSGLSKPTLSPTAPYVNTSFTLTCPTAVTNNDCIKAYIDNNPCTWVQWSGNNSIYTCSAPTTGTHTAKCSSIAGTTYGCCASETSTTFTVNPAAGSTSTTYLLSVTKSGSGTITSSPSGINCGSTCSYSFNSGTLVTLTASPSSGYTFSGWSGACSGQGSCTVTMSAARSVTAAFSTAPTGSCTQCYVGPAISNRWILPTTAVSTMSSYGYSQLSAISISAAKGEFESANFVIRPNSTVTLTPTLTTNLTNVSDNSKTIPASKVNIRYVKAWWQAAQGSLPYKKTSAQSPAREIVPELLLKNPSFVLRGDERGNSSDQNNYIKKTDGSYVSISGAVGTPANYQSTADFSIQDDSTLQAITIPAGKNQQIWITVEVATNTYAGNYAGTINLGSLGSVSLTVTVLPFILEPTPLEYVMWNQMDISVGSIGTIGVVKSETQAYNEYKSMREHGITAPTITETTGSTLTEKIFPWFKALGFSKRIYYNGSDTYSLMQSTSTSFRQSLYDAVTRIKGLAQRNYTGFSDLYIYGKDEYYANNQKVNEKHNYRTVHLAGAKVYECSWTDGVKDTFDQVGTDPANSSTGGLGYLDLIVWPSTPSSVNSTWPIYNDREPQWHAAGGKIMSYLNPMAGVEWPETYRRNYGFLLWQHKYDGAEQFGWQFLQSGGSVWNDFGGNDWYRSQTFAFPTKNGVVETIELEGLREGIDDTRYIATLEKTINGISAPSARAYLANLRTEGTSLADLSGIRAQLISYIVNPR